MNLFNKRYRVESTRLPGWDYSQVGYYFVTICTKSRVHIFGDVVFDEIQLTPIGEIVAQEWIKTELIRPNVIFDEWVIMPNHMHMIVVITHKIESSPVETPRRGVSTIQQSQTKAASAKWAANTLGSIIGQFKGKCTKLIRMEGYSNFAWQSRYYDHIIRSEESLHKARNYIASNPLNWDKDVDNVAGLNM
jgi:REP element-mobilizing transposase RayT